MDGNIKKGTLLQDALLPLVCMVLQFYIANIQYKPQEDNQLDPHICFGSTVLGFYEDSFHCDHKPDGKKPLNHSECRKTKHEKQSPTGENGKHIKQPENHVSNFLALFLLIHQEQEADQKQHEGKSPGRYVRMKKRFIQHKITTFSNDNNIISHFVVS